MSTDTGSTPTLDGFDPLAPEYLADPRAFMLRAQKECPVFYYEPLDFWVVTRYDDIVAVLKDWETFSSRAFRAVPVPPELRDRIPAAEQRIPEDIITCNFINLDPPAHTIERRSAQKAFTRKLIAGTEGRIREIANDLIDTFVDAGRCDLMQDFSYKLSLQVIIELIGLPTETMPRFRDWIDDFFSLMAPANLRSDEQAQILAIGEIERRYARVAEAHAFFVRFLEERRKDPRDDLATAMILARNEDGASAMTDTQIIAHLIEITAAGSDTTANLIGHMVWLFTRQPEALAEIVRDLSLWENAIEEGLRRSVVTTHLFRITTRDVEICGVTIPAGSKVAAPVPAANTDESKFPDPSRFDPRRSNADEHLAFGSGRHLCMGAPLARLEARAALQELYRRIPDITADLGQQLEFVPAITTPGLKRLAVSWTVR
jgi:cytochrome P450